ncbi:hypothetical protein RCC89_02230 [Cytophagaceae bacterium ABcell3]|nr:hypothetical protein RCC89_02230 [Cytophagaceae bacterium ABcell3]
MKKFFILFILSTINVISYGQNFEIGTGIQFISFRGADVTSPVYEPVVEDRFIFNAMVSAHIPIHSPNNEIVFGFNPGLSMGSLSATVATDIPLLLTARYGAGSSDKSSRTFGFGMGAGAFLSFINSWINNMRPVPYSFAYVTPIITGELAYLPKSGRLFRLRGEYTPLSLFRSDETFQGLITQLNIRLIRDF